MPKLPKFLPRDEKLVYMTSLHWVHVLIALFFPAVIIYFGVILDHYIVQYAWSLPRSFSFTLWGFYFDPLHPPVIPFAVLIALVVSLPHLALYFTTRIYLTENSIFKKSGLLSQDILEIDLEEVKGERVHKGMFGHVFGYGDVVLDCRFIGDVKISSVKHPDFLVRKVNKMRKRLSENCPESDGDKHNRERRRSVL